MANVSVEESPLYVRAVLLLLNAWLFIYDSLVFLPFALFANPQEKLRKSRRLKAKPLVDGDASAPWRSVDSFDQLLVSSFPDVRTIDKLWKRAVLLFADRDCMASRRVLSVEQERVESGKLFEKVTQGPYEWQSFGQVDAHVRRIGAGLSADDVRAGDRIVVFAETRAEWLQTAIACFSFGFTVVTVYATLGDDAIVHAVNETDAVAVVTSQDLMPKVAAIMSSCGSVRLLVYFPSTNPDRPNLDRKNLKLSRPNVRVLSLEELENSGQESQQRPSGEISADDLALIMYTSGTTGAPKGVMISHGNVVASTAGQAAAVPALGPDDVYLGYLPLAHILEVGAELCCLSHGARIGYSSPLTLHDRASKVKRGTQGDCRALQPTLMAAVPAIMDRIYKAVTEEVSQSSALMQAFFHLTYERKRARIEDGYDDPFLNRLVFRRIRALLGGRLRAMLSGGAALNAETQRFMNICFCCPVAQGYGLTETCGAGTICDSRSAHVTAGHDEFAVNDLKTGRVGPPLQCNDIMLRDWDEGGYRARNEPRPQGEVLLAGANVSLGYWKNAEKTAEEFIVLGGRRWFCSGDIGEVHADGSLEIIDRKKDLLKLAHGEYVSLARVETALLTAPIVDNICVCANADRNGVVALVVPNAKQLHALAEANGIDVEDWAHLCADKSLAVSVQQELARHAAQAKNGLAKWEVPSKVYLCEEVWTPASGLLTEALKLRRKPIEEHYKKILG